MIFDEHDVSNAVGSIDTAGSTRSNRVEQKTDSRVIVVVVVPSGNQCMCSKHAHHSHGKGALECTLARETTGEMVTVAVVYPS